MQFLMNYGLFLAKTATLVISILFLMGGTFAMTRKPKPKLEIMFLNEQADSIKHKMEKEILGKKPKKKKKKEKEIQRHLYVIDFHGDLAASQVEGLREEISAVLSIANPKDEVIVRLETPGGIVNGYGLGASQLQRIRDRKIPLTICIDKIATSGGYLMACVADQIIAAPFAILGSIGVVAQMPNFYRWLKKNDIDVELLTAGEYKRTLTVFGKNTEKGRQKFQEDLEDIHQVFRNFVVTNRPGLNIDEIATGEHWLAKDAFDLKLVDKLQTSDEYINEKMLDFNIYKIKFMSKLNLLNKLLKPMAKLFHPWG